MKKRLEADHLCHPGMEGAKSTGNDEKFLPFE